MKDVWNKIADSANDAKSFAEEISANGIDFLKSNFEKIPLFSATHADVNAAVERDETHYFLVPFRSAPEETTFALYTIRSLPPEIGPVNSLEKARIFHLHDEAATVELEKLLLSETKSKITSENPTPDADFADRLDELAVKIDSANNVATGGLLVVGSLVALANPLLGAGIAAKALFPSLGGAAATSGLKYMTDKLRKAGVSAHDRKALKAAEKEVKKLKPETRINPILKEWRAVLAAVESGQMREQDFEIWRLEMGGVEAIHRTELALSAVHREFLELSPRKSPLRESERAWLTELHELSEAALEFLNGKPNSES